MSKKNILFICIFSFSLLLLIFFFIFLMLNNEKSKTFDLNKLNEEILEKGDFNTSNLKDIDEEYITSVLEIDKKSIKDFIGKVPIIDISSNMYVIIEANTKEDVAVIKEKLNDYLEKQKEFFSRYLLSEHNLLYESKVEEKGKYVYLIVCENMTDIKKLF